MKEYGFMPEAEAAVDEWAFEPNAAYKQRNAEMNLAWQFVAQTGISVFLTGRAGTGKTTFLRKLNEIMPKRMVVLAPTGVAAINAGGQTIHSFFQLPFGPFIPGSNTDNKRVFSMSKRKKDMIRTLDLLVIDEVSMVRADLLDLVDHTLRKFRDHSKPFGGVQLLLIGDLMQLSPVANDADWEMLKPHYDTPYFFSSHALAQLRYATVELKHIYRQNDIQFVNLLEKVRTHEIDDEAVRLLNSRHIPAFEPKEAGWIRLTTHNYAAKQYNDTRLNAIKAPARQFEATVKGDFPETSYPADAILTVKVGAQVMFVKNDLSGEHKYFNGKIGTITNITGDVIEVKCKGDNEPIAVKPVEWENVKYTIDAETKDITEKVEGIFSQYPLRLAWAITVHKSQGLTFDHAVLDINASFAHGQVYVALSRCRTLQGLVLSSPVNFRSIITDNNVTQYIDSQRDAMKQSEEALPEMKREYTLTLLDELYSFDRLTQTFLRLERVVYDYLGEKGRALHLWLSAKQPFLLQSIVEVAKRFRQHYLQALDQYGTNIGSSPFSERIMQSAKYFVEKLTEWSEPIWKMLVVNIENKQTAETYTNAVRDLKSMVNSKLQVFKLLSSEPFSMSNYLNAKAKGMLSDEAEVARAKKPRAQRPQKPKKPKPQRGDSARKSLELFHSGKTVAQIAEERHMAESTIFGHLSDMVSAGVLSFDEIVPPSHSRLISNAISTFTESYTVTDVKEKLPSDISMGEIYAVIRQHRENASLPSPLAP